MRYPSEHKKETHKRIIESASQEFRTKGFEGVGIASLMGTLNLTHGGFYAHFADKEALVSEASVVAMEQSLETMLDKVESGGIPALLVYYLSEGHRDSPQWGCPLPALCAEIARRPLPSRDAFTQKLREVFTAIAAYMPGEFPEQRLEKVQVMFATMTGAVALARALSDPVVSASMLYSTQKYLLRFIDAD